MSPAPSIDRPAGAEMPVVELMHLLGEPRADVDAVGDVADRHLLLGPPGKSGVHMARDTWPWSDDTALARRDSFSASTVMQNPSFGSEALVRPSASSSSALIDIAARSGPRCSSTRCGAKAIVAGGHRRMCRKHDLRGNSSQRLGRADPFGLHPLTRQLQRGEGAVSFVEMDDARRDAERLERLDAAHAEQQLLPDADAIVAAVQARGQIAIFGLVALDIGIEQQQSVSADGQLPDARGERARARVDADGDRLAARISRLLERQERAVDVAVVFLLIAAHNRSAA